MFLSYNFASERGVASLFLNCSGDIRWTLTLQRYLIHGRLFDGGKQILEACFRNLLGLATRMFRENNRCIVERDCGGFDDVD